ncbi:hypothetical protein V6N11_058716 [Hibiscus sabdariffa]|uniref:RNase H type-1 domain-containing protein n=1 Tax=Hibiscus sabdariffa TaxID=183260 RepID=A0ABR2U5C3_9ROSI
MTQTMATQTWLAPSVGWWKVNTNDSRLLGSGASTCGGVIGDCDGSGVSSLVHYIQEALQRPWEVVVQYVPCTGNMVTDRIAKMAHHASMEIVVLGSRPWGAL